MQSNVSSTAFLTFQVDYLRTLGSTSLCASHSPAAIMACCLPLRLGIMLVIMMMTGSASSTGE
eukprot:1734905-Rhodomonas_salina.1